MNLIGKITGIHGLKGEVTIHHQLKKNTRFNTWDCIMVELNTQSFIPFFIESIKSISDDECICKFEEINNRDEAKSVLNKSVYSSINYVVENIKTTNLQQFVGYAIYAGENKIGDITEAIENKMNNMFLVNYEGKELLLPSSPELIEAIDHKKKRIEMIIPDGLLDL